MSATVSGCHVSVTPHAPTCHGTTSNYAKKFLPVMEANWIVLWVVFTNYSFLEQQQNWHCVWPCKQGAISAAWDMFHGSTCYVTWAILNCDCSAGSDTWMCLCSGVDPVFNHPLCGWRTIPPPEVHSRQLGNQICFAFHHLKGLADCNFHRSHISPWASTPICSSADDQTFSPRLLHVNC